MELNNRIFDDECSRPDEVNLSVARHFVQMGYSVTEVRKFFKLYDKTEEVEHDETTGISKGDL